MKLKLIVTFIMFILLLFFGHNESNSSSDIREIPSIETFSGNELISCEDNPYADIEKVILYKNGESSNIDANDYKLIRMLNFCSYSEKKGYSAFSVGQTDRSYDYEEKNRVEIFFSGVKSYGVDYNFTSYDKMVITDDQVVLIQTNPLHEAVIYDDGFCMLYWYPYGLCEKIENLEILTYCGF